MTNEGYNAYGTANLEQQRGVLYNLFDTLKAAFYAFVAQKKSEIVAMASIVDVGSNANITYIADNCAGWAEGSEQTLPSGMIITYSANVTYIGAEG